MDRQALHAKSLTLYHPLREETMTFNCSMPQDMKDLIEKMKVQS